MSKRRIGDVEDPACRYFVSAGLTAALRQGQLHELPGYDQAMLIDVLTEIYETPGLLSSLVDGSWRERVWFPEDWS